MCRLAAFAGPPASLSSVLFDPPRSLQVQAYDPHEMQRGHVNVDGTGIVWFDEGSANAEPDHRPLRYRTQLPPWGDQTLVELAPRMTSRIILAAVRSSTAGIPQGQAFVHPFVAGNLAGTHNGWISDFRPRVARPLMARLSDDSFGMLDGMSDANVLFLLAADAYRDGATLIDAARHATDVAAKVCAELGATATLTLALADHTGVAVMNAACGRPANSLYVHDGGDHRLVASEPLDPRLDWDPVGDGAGVAITPTSMELC
ncbi:MAG: class II glutamine amidotransferase [Euzebya sp.]